jgi:heme exporter protein C
MKPLIMLSALTLGIIWSIFTPYDKPKKKYWHIISLLLLLVAFFVNLIPPVSTTPNQVSFFTKNMPNIIVPVLLRVNVQENSYNQELNTWKINYSSIDGGPSVDYFHFNGKELLPELKSNDKLVVALKYNKTTKVNEFYALNFVNPWYTFPFIPQLGEKIKIMNFHVPVAWLCVVAYIVSMIFSIKYLKSRNMDHDLVAYSSAAIGTIFTILATVTGMIWAKFNWGSYWNWDPREVSIFVLLLIYAAYFTLRSSIENEETKAKLSSVYSILATFTVPFFIFILPRITSGLHPGAANEGNSGPVMSSNQNMLDSYMLYGFGISLLVTTIIYFWLLNVTVRQKRLMNKI